MSKSKSREIPSKETSLRMLVDLLQPLQVLNFQEKMVSNIVFRPEESSAGAAYGVFDEYLRYGVWTKGASLLSQLAAPPAAFITQCPISDVNTPQLLVADALKATAIAARFLHDEPDAQMNMIGITGSKGKTTTAHLVAQWLCLLGEPSASMGTLGLKLSDGTIIDVGYTTPLAPDLYRALALAHQSGTRAVAMELSSHAIALNRHYGLSLDVRIFTNLGRDHLDFHGTLDEYRKVKERLFLEGDGMSVLNADDPVGQALASQLKNSITYGFSETAEVHAKLISTDAAGSDLMVSWRGNSVASRCPLVGQFNVSNYLAAAACCLALGFEFDQIMALGGGLSSVPGRLESVTLPEGRIGIVDFAHTAESLEQVLMAVKASAPKRVILVFGCGGDRDKGKRPLMGAVAARLADMSFVTSDNPRSEDPASIVASIAEGMGSAPYQIEVDRRKAIQCAVAWSAPGDVILVAGKGHETEQIFADRTEHFSDKEVLLCLS
jgi:UDP-N-acetylmuramoyl-L-alanyl-D-glutamate--2,6-diaminopimelate ligase